MDATQSPPVTAETIALDGPRMSEHASRTDIAGLARSYGRHVFQAAYRVLGDAALAEDVQQDVFVRLLENTPEAGVDSWPAYLSTSATRLAIDRLRRQRRWWRLLPGWLAQQPEHAPSAEAHVADVERALRLREALARLKPREAECFALRHLHGLEIPAIAAAVGISENYVSVSLHRAVKALEARLGEPPNTLVEGDRT